VNAFAFNKILRTASDHEPDHFFYVLGATLKDEAPSDFWPSLKDESANKLVHERVRRRRNAREIKHEFVYLSKQALDFGPQFKCDTTSANELVMRALNKRNDLFHNASNR